MIWPGRIEDGCDRNREAYIRSYSKIAYKIDKMKLWNLDIYILFSLIQKNSLNLRQDSNLYSI